MENANDGMLESLRNVIRLHEQREIVFRNKEAMLVNSAREMEKNLNKALADKEEEFSRAKNMHFREKEELLKSMNEFLIIIAAREKKEKELLERLSAVLLKVKENEYVVAEKDKIIKGLKEAVDDEKALWKKRSAEEDFQKEASRKNRGLLPAFNKPAVKQFNAEAEELEKKWEALLMQVKECAMRLSERLKIST